MNIRAAAAAQLGARVLICIYPVSFNHIIIIIINHTNIHNYSVAFRPRPRLYLTSIEREDTFDDCRLYNTSPHPVSALSCSYVPSLKANFVAPRV